MQARYAVRVAARSFCSLQCANRAARGPYRTPLSKPEYRVVSGSAPHAQRSRRPRFHRRHRDDARSSSRRIAEVRLPRRAPRSSRQERPPDAAAASASPKRSTAPTPASMSPAAPSRPTAPRSKSTSRGFCSRMFFSGSLHSAVYKGSNLSAWMRCGLDDDQFVTPGATGALDRDHAPPFL